MCYLLELGLRAARAARWLGAEQSLVREGPVWVNTWPEEIWQEAAAAIAADPAPRHAHPHPPLPEPRCSAWEYASKAGLLTGHGDAEFARELHDSAWYVGRRRGLPWQDGCWPGSVWSDVADAMAQAAAERGETRLGEDELDAVADGFLPDPEYRSRPAPRPAAVVHCQRAPYDVYVGRPGPWGNPYEIGRDGTREQVIAKYAAWIVTQPQLTARLGELRGKVLGCWCKPLPCHGDVLAAMAARVPGYCSRVADPEHPHGYWEAGDYG
jgi:Domain of unknown function (DUF4326)